MEKAKFVQDVPPPGGYPMVEFRRYFPKRGVPILAAVATGVGLYVYGHYRIALANQKRHHVQNERLQNNIDVALSLQAEEDLRYIAHFRRTTELEQADIARRGLAHADGLLHPRPNGPAERPDHSDRYYRTRWMPPTRPVRPNYVGTGYF